MIELGELISGQAAQVVGSKTSAGKRLFEHDSDLGVRFVGGVDEAGRGCLAGPMVAAGVVFDMSRMRGPALARFNDLNDSKKLGIETREHLLSVILEACACVNVVLVSANSIDRRGLHKSNLHAMRRVVSTFSGIADLVLVDGFDPGASAVETRRLVKGDSTSAAIAAASIVAKVTRDRLMRELDKLSGGLWCFSEHKGYATAEHRALIEEHGPSQWHRMSFASSSYDLHKQRVKTHS